MTNKNREERRKEEKKRRINNRLAVSKSFFNVFVPMVFVLIQIVVCIVNRYKRFIGLIYTVARNAAYIFRSFLHFGFPLTARSKCINGCYVCIGFAMYLYAVCMRWDIFFSLIRFSLSYVSFTSFARMYSFFEE